VIGAHRPPNFAAAVVEETKARTLAGADAHDALKLEDALRTALAAHGPAGYWQAVLAAAPASSSVPEAYTTNSGVAVVYARLGEKAKAVDALERAYDERELAMTELGVEPAFDALRADGRFRRLLARVGLGP
jgi:hypothetical protein